MESTRNQILNYLGDHTIASTVEIARYLEMTPANIRYHLDILQEAGQVQVSGQRSPGGAGRPILLYSLTSSYLGNNLKPLLEAVLRWMENTGDAEQIGEEIAGLLAGDLSLPGNRIQRYNHGIQFLNQHRYHANWEARPEGPQITLRHCPYQDLAERHPLLCQVDEQLLSRLIGENMTLTVRRRFGEHPYSPCIFTPQAAQKV